MSNSGVLQKLKGLHESLHLNKGLMDVVAIHNVCSSNETFVPLPGNKEICSRTNQDIVVNEEKCIAQESSSLFQAVQNIYDGERVELTPHKIFVGNISYGITTPQLKAFFLTFGRVLHAQIIKERVKRRSKGYGFVTFSKESEVQNVLKAPEEKLILDGRVLRINRAEKKRRGKHLFTVKPFNITGRNIHDTSCEINPKISIEAFVQKYNETAEYCQSEVGEEDSTAKSSGADSEMLANVCEISSLTDDTLLHVFSFLNIGERVTIERVCHRWLHLARKTWLGIKHLDFNGIFRSFRGTGGLTDGILLSLFRRGCQNLKCLDLSHSSRLLTDYSLYLIGQNCVDLEQLNLSGVNVTMKSLKDLSSKCCKLKKVELQRCHDVGEKALWWLFKQCQELEYIDVQGNIRITGQCFFMLTDNCKSVILNDCVKLTDGGIQLLMKRCPSLTELEISRCLHLTDMGVIELFKAGGNLRRLVFCEPSKNVSSQSLMALRNLTLLEELQLAQQEAVNNDVLYVVANNCSNIRFLNIEACHAVTDTGIQYLSLCVWLDKLVISYLDKVTDSSIETLAQNGVLKIIHARSCLNITDKAIEQLAIHCPNIQELDFSGSERIWNASLDLVEKYLGDKRNMTLVVGGTGVTRERALLTKERHPNWSITTQDLSDHHLRVDFDPYMDMGRILPDYDDDDDDEEEEDVSQYDAEYYLSADDPSMWEYDQQWIS